MYIVTKLLLSYVRVALVTFAADVTVHFNGMEDLENDLLKCKIWETYWQDVTVEDDPLIWREAHVKMAYEKAKDIFNRYGSSSRKKYIWILTSGAYSSGVYNPIPIRDELVNFMNVEIVATKTAGNEADANKIIQIISGPSHYGKEVIDWKTRLEELPYINGKVSIYTLDILGPFVFYHVYKIWISLLNFILLVLRSFYILCLKETLVNKQTCLFASFQQLVSTQTNPILSIICCILKSFNH